MAAAITTTFWLNPTYTVISDLRLDRKTKLLTGKIKVLVVDDQMSVREGTRALLHLARDIDATREACNGQEAVQLVAEDGTFTWQRETRKKIYVYFRVGELRSNRVIIPVR